MVVWKKEEHSHFPNEHTEYHGLIIQPQDFRQAPVQLQEERPKTKQHGQQSYRSTRNDTHS